MLSTNLRLSQEERHLLLDEHFILTKRNILTKLEQLFGKLSDEFRNEMIRRNLEQESFARLAPKIARGENYKGLPWVMMDYPRLFTRTDTCAIRCFFWWGHYCSITLQLSGFYQQHYQMAIHRFIQEQQHAEDWLYYVGEDPWQHIINTENHKPLSAINDFQDIMLTPFLKITKKIPLEEWDVMDEFFIKNFGSLLSVLEHYAPKR